MKILYLITRAERGGAQVHLVDLLSSLPAGYRAVVATGESGFLTEAAENLGIPVRLLPSLVQPISPWADLKALKALLALIRIEDPDLVHAHTSKAGLLGRLAAFLTRTPSIFTAHTWSFTDGVPWKQRSVAVPLERLAAAVSAKVISVSMANIDMALRRSVVRRNRLVCIWNGVPDVSCRADLRSSKQVRIVMVARFAPQKDHAILIQAMRELRGDWCAVLAGDGPTRDSIEMAVHKWGLQDRVAFTGERSDVPELLATGDIFVLPSKWEGLPLSILEAMRAGLPVVATMTGGTPEAVTDGVTGYLTPPGSVTIFRERLQELVSSEALRRRMGLAARKRYEQDFRIETMVQKTIAVYDEVGVASKGMVPFSDTRNESFQ